MTPRRRSIIAGLVLATALAVTGCGPEKLPKVNMQTPTQAHEAVYTALSDAIDFFGGPTGWSAPWGNPPEQCTVKGQPGVSYTEIQQGPGTGTEQKRDELAKTLVKHLQDQGYTAYIAEHNPKDPNRRVYANSGPVENFSAYIAPDGISIQATSWCVVGKGTDTSTPPPTRGH